MLDSQTMDYEVFMSYQGDQNETAEVLVIPGES